MVDYKKDQLLNEPTIENADHKIDQHLKWLTIKKVN